MAIFVLTDAYVSVNSVDISDYVTSVSLPFNAAQVDTTAMGDSWNTAIGGLKSGSITINLHNDFVDDGLDEDMFALLGTVTAVAVRPTSSAISTANPEYQFDVLVTEWKPVDGSVGDLAATSVTWPFAGAVTRDTTA